MLNPLQSNIFAQISVGMGRMGLLYPSHQAAPDFVINITASMKCATSGIRLNKDLQAFRFCPSIAALYSRELNPDSTYLHCFHSLVTSIAEVECAPAPHLRQRQQRTSSLKHHHQAPRGTLRNHTADKLLLNCT